MARAPAPALTDEAVPAGGPDPPAAPATWHRHPADVAHLIVAAVVAVLLGVLQTVEPGGLRRLGRDTLDVVDRLPPVAADILNGTFQVAAIGIPLVAAVGLAWARRWRLLGTLVIAAAGGVGLMVLVAQVVESADDVATSWLTGAEYSSGAYLAALTAVATAAAPSITRPWRRTVYALVAIGVVLRVGAAAVDPVTVALVVAVGATAGSAVLVAFGAWRRPIELLEVRQALTRCGLEPATIEPAGTSEQRSVVFSARTDDGTHLRAVVIGRDDRDTDALLTVWRWLQVRGLGDPLPLPRGSRLADRATVAASLADAAGVRVPRPLGLARTPASAVVLVEPWIDGPGLDEADGDLLTPAVLEDVWAQVHRLHERGIAHRQLRGDRIRLGADGPTVVGFRTAEIDAPQQARDADVVQLLVETALRVGAGPAVAAARAVVGDDDLVRVLPLLQPVVLQPRTRSAAGQAGTIGEVRDEVERVTGEPAPDLADVKRISLAGTVSLVGATVLGYYIVSLASDAGDIWSTLRDARWELLPWLLVLMVLQYVAGAFTLMGAVPDRLALGRTTQVMFAQSFLNRFTPANAGGMALRTRYLQREGIPLGGAASAVGLTSAVNGVVQTVLLVGFVLLGESSSSNPVSDLSLPSASVILVVIVAIGAAAGLVLASTWGRSTLRPWLAETGQAAWANVSALGRDPGKLALLGGGALGCKVLNALAFVVSARALGVDLAFVSLFALYFLATTVGAAVPTPGGVGGVEAALTAALTSSGVDPATAASVVLLFRLVTFWLPVVPGWFLLQRVQAKDYV
ncbi:MAG TPA: lysylphosphatidylglycerol synthase domain-containing protein [Iamia sp.]